MPAFEKRLFSASLDALQDIENFIEGSLTAHKIKRKAMLSAKLISEETLTSVINGGYAESDISVGVRKTAWKTDVLLKFKGPRYELNASDTGLDLSEGSDDETQGVISSLILKSYAEKISPSYRNGMNTITISAAVSSQRNIVFCLYAILFAVLIGVPLRLFASGAVLSVVTAYILSPVTTILMNALKMLMVPVIFFSIAASMSTFKDIKELGRIGAKVVGFYVFTTLIAIVISFGTFFCLNSIETGAFSYLSDGLISETAEVSLLTTLINIVPTNIFASFHEGNTLQLIFLAIVLGMCAGRTGKYSDGLSRGINALNELFMKVAELVTQGLPIIVFCAITSMIITMDLDLMASIASVLGLMVIASIIMNLFYLTYSSLKMHKSPLEIIKKAGPGWLNAFSLSSSNASIPYSMEVCKNRLKISPKLYSFSIPLGATINMDGTTIMLVLFGLSLTKGFGITMNMGDYFSMISIIVILSMGTPGLPGAALMSFTIVCQSFNVPAAGVALLTPIMLLFDPLGTADNIFGDICGTYCVAHSEGLIDE